MVAVLSRSKSASSVYGLHWRSNTTQVDTVPLGTVDAMKVCDSELLASHITKSEKLFR